MRIALIAPLFFGYRKRVQDEFARLGHSVSCFDDRPSEGVAFKSLAKVSYKLVSSKIDAYSVQIAHIFSDEDFDLVIYMGGMSFCFTRKQFQLVRSSSKARFVAYLWDSLSNCQRFLACKDLFDNVFSFEPTDCNKYNLHLRPLFYSNEYLGLPLVPQDGFRYDACFIGSVHQPSKFGAVVSICDQLEAQGLRVFKYFYMPSKSVEVLRKASKLYRNREFAHQPLSASQVADIYMNSKAIIDSPQAGQAGLTMRTLETLGARRKLITTNADAANYDFAKTGNVAIWDGSLPLESDFFESDFRDLPNSVYDSYSIEMFSKTLLDKAPSYCGYEREC